MSFEEQILVSLQVSRQERENLLLDLEISITYDNSSHLWENIGLPLQSIVEIEILKYIGL